MLRSLCSCSHLGSSPLARGLRLGGADGAGSQRIIPARAGFTSIEAALLESQLGSSPLARGLPAAAAGGGVHPGIIPARAGFTGPSRRLCSSPPDHPRSRGVYCWRATSRRTVLGSSPLARGLHARDRVPADRRRIIPARAGFTPSASRPHTWRSDHPRSRGVYRTEIICRWTTLGSSPLARGLPQSILFIPLTRGIIPARAGFTIQTTQLG